MRQATSPLLFRSGGDAIALTQIEQCVAKQVAGGKVGMWVRGAEKEAEGPKAAER